MMKRCMIKPVAEAREILELKQTPPRKITKESRVVMTDAAISQSMYGRAGVLVCVPDAYVSRATLSLGA